MFYLIFRSLHPPELTSLLLDHTLSSPFGPAHESAFAALTKVFAHLALTHRHALRLCLVDKVRLLLGEKGCAGGENAEGRLMNLFVLLKLLTSCRALLDIVAEDILSLGESWRHFDFTPLWDTAKNNLEVLFSYYSES